MNAGCESITYTHAKNQWTLGCIRARYPLTTGCVVLHSLPMSTKSLCHVQKQTKMRSEHTHILELTAAKLLSLILLSYLWGVFRFVCLCADYSTWGKSIASLCISVCCAGNDSSSVASVFSCPSGSSSVGVTNSVITPLTVVSVAVLSSHPSTPASSLSSPLTPSSSSSSVMKTSPLGKFWLIEL